MSVDEIQRIMNHLDRQDEKISKIQVDVSTVMKAVADVPVVVEKLGRQDTAIKLMEKDHKNCQLHCEAIQLEKKTKSINWGAVKTNVIVGTLMLIVGAVFATWITIG